MKKVVTNLTRDGLILLEEGAKSELYLQILKIDEIKREKTSNAPNQNRYFNVVLNDGFAQNSYIFIAEAAKKVENLRPFIVISPSNDLKSLPNYKRKMLMDFEIINDRVAEEIGHPIDLEIYRRGNRMNFDGNTSIPFKYLDIRKQTQHNEDVAPKEEDLEDLIRENQNDFNRQQATLQTMRIKEEEKMNTVNNTIESSRKSFFEKFKNIKQQPNLDKPQTPKQQFQLTPWKAPTYNNQEFFLPIAALRPTTHDWRIKAMVVKKNDLKSFISPFKSHPSKLLKLTLMDRERDEIGAIFYDQEAEYFNERIDESKVYGFSRGTIKEAKPAFNMTKNKYEIVFGGNSEIIPLSNDGEFSVPKCDFKTVKEVLSLNLNEIVDVRGIVSVSKYCDSFFFIHKKDVENSVSEVTLRSGEKNQKRRLTLFDESEQSIELTLWGKQADQDFLPNSIVIFKRLKVSEFSGSKSLNTTFDTLIIPYSEESMPELQSLHAFWKSQEAANIFSRSSRKSLGVMPNFRNDEKPVTLEQIAQESRDLIFSKDKKIFVGFFYILRFLNETAKLYYPACINEKCNKKVVPLEEGFRCENCQKEFSEPRYRYILQAYICDNSESLRITIFDEVATEILGVTAKELKTLKEECLIDEINSIFNKGKFMEIKAKIMAKYVNYQGIEKIDYSLIGFTAASPKERIAESIGEIKEYLSLAQNNRNIN